MKKFIVILSVLVLLVFSCILVSCGNSDRNQEIIKDIETYYKVVDGVEKLHIKVTYFDGSVEERTVDVPKRIVSVTLKEDTFVAMPTAPELSITVLYDDETTEDVVITKDMIKGGAIDFSTAGEYTLSIEYKAKELTTPVYILPAEDVYAYTAGVLTKYDTFEQALINADTGSTITMCEDLALTTDADAAIVIEKDLVIDGRGHTISTSTNRKVFEAYANLELRNLIIVNKFTSGRCVDTRVDNIRLVLSNVTLDMSEATGAAQPLTIGGSNTDTENPVTVLATKTTIKGNADSYAVITFVPVSMTLDVCEVSGWSCIYIKPDAATSNVTVNASKLKVETAHSGESNSFGAIVLEANATVSVGQQSTIDIKNTGDIPYFVVLVKDMNPAEDVITPDAVNVTIDAAITKEGNIVDGQTNVNNIVINGVTWTPLT